MKSASKAELFRELPSVDELVRTPGLAAVALEHGIAAVTDAARAVLSRLREEISSGLLDGGSLQIALSGITGAIESHLRQALSLSLRAVIRAFICSLFCSGRRLSLSRMAWD